MANPNRTDRTNEVKTLLEKQRDACRAFWADSARHGRPHPSKRWTFEELELKFPPYRNMRTTGTMIDRDTLIELCLYLECHAAQTDAILLAAGYAPYQIYPTGDALTQALRICRTVMIDLPMPAYVLKPDWSIDAWNGHILTLLGWSHATARRLQIDNNLNVLKLIFDPELQLRSAFRDWDMTARRNLLGFKITNMLAQHEPWYNEIKDAICGMGSEEEALWNSVQPSTTTLMETLDYVTDMQLSTGKVISFRSLFICPGDYHYPHVAAYLPNDADTWLTFAELNIPIAAQRRLLPEQ